MRMIQETMILKGQAAEGYPFTEPVPMDESLLEEKTESHVLGIYPEYTFQRFEGYGCALTESSCYLLSCLSAQKRREALQTWFGPDGVDARFVRIHMDSCDYSLSEYQAVGDPLEDPDLQGFSIDRDRKCIIPVVKEAMGIAGHPISILLSPWSPPRQWKTPPEVTKNEQAVYGGMGIEVNRDQPSRCFGGRLQKRYYKDWAKYIVKYIQAYLDEGIPVAMLSIQNEASASTSWDSCIWSSEEEREFLRFHLYPQMREAGLAETVGIYIWDHNKERAIEHIDAFLKDPDVYDMVQGFAFHWYTGDHFEVLDLLHRKYPGKILMHSESCPLHMPGQPAAYEFSEADLEKMGEDRRKMYAGGAQEDVDSRDAADYAHDLIGDLNGGLQRWIDWNMIVDRQGGPRHVPGGFSAPLIYEGGDRYTELPAYRAIRLIARTIRSGAVRIGKSTYCREIEMAAALNPDGSIGVVLLNNSMSDQTANIRIAGKIVRDITLPAESLNAITILSDFSFAKMSGERT